MKARIPALNAKQRAAAYKEIQRQCRQSIYDAESDHLSMLIYCLNTKFGFGKKRILELLKEIIKVQRELNEYYRLKDDEEYPENRNDKKIYAYEAVKMDLKNKGLDVEDLLEELEVEQDENKID